MSTNAPEIVAFRYAREDVLNPKGLQTWRELMGRAVLGLDLELLSEQSFRSEVATRFLPDMRITFATKAGLRMERSRSLLADGADDLALHICMEGEWAIEHRGRAAPLRRGEAVLISDAETASVTCTSTGRCVCIQIARSALAPLVPHFGDTLMCPVPRDDKALQLLISYVKALGASRPLHSPALRGLAASHIRDLVALVLGATRDDAANAANGGVRAARLRSIKADIERYIDNPGLSVAAIAARHRITPRYVQALFKDEGTTFSGFVAARRLARAHSLLASPQHSDRRIAEIAFSVGFGDLSRFNRAFRRQYGVTPSDVRALAFVE